jgi:hypothetical protein
MIFFFLRHFVNFFIYQAVYILFIHIDFPYIFVLDKKKLNLLIPEKKAIEIYKGQNKRLKIKTNNDKS